jgi:CheY-like chemotaxis protein
VVAASTEVISHLIGVHITQRLRLGAAGVRINADATEIEQILLNLSANSRDAMPDGGELTITTAIIPAAIFGDSSSGPMVRLSVLDRGCGMDAATRDRVFEPFFTTRRPGQGAGLGLSTVFAVAQRLGGRIEVQSELGKFTELAIFLPIVEIAPSEQCVREPKLERRCSGPVLLVEDQALVRVTVKSYLEQLGYDTLTAASPAEAIELCDARGAELGMLVSDVVMPGMLGPQLAEALRRRFPALKVVFMSAHPREELAAFAGLDDSEVLLEKPFEREALELALRAKLKD